MLDRGRLPDPVGYYRGQGFELNGRAIWRSERCPFHDDRHPSFRINTVDGGFYCPACDAKGGDIIAFHMAKFGLSFADAVIDLAADDGQARQNGPGSTIARAPVPKPQPKPDRAAEADSARKTARADAILRDAKLIPGTLVAEYLLSRGCRLPPADGDLRFVPDLRLFGFSGPAMVAAITDVHDHERLQGLHITWLKQGDGICWVRGERRYLGSTRGGVVRLWPNEAVVYSLAVGEGIETCLCGAHLHAPVWSCMDAGGLARFPVLNGVELLTVFADRDRSGTGQAAAATVAERWLAAEREVVVLTADQVGSDLADEVSAACSG